MFTNKLRGVIIALACSLIAGCAALGTPTPQTTNEKLAAGYVTVTTVRHMTMAAVETRRISPDDAQNVNKQCDNVREGLDLVRSLKGVDAEDKLTSTLIVLTELQKYVNSKVKP